MNRKRLLQSKKLGHAKNFTPVNATRKGKIPNRAGSVVALVLLVVVILSIIGGGLLSLGLHSRIFAIRTTSEITARTAADAGLAKAVFEMNEKLKVKPWNDSVLPQVTNEALPNCDAVFSYTVTKDGDNGYIVESVGKSNQAERKVRGALPLQGPFEYAIFTQGDLRLKNGATVNWYNYDTDERRLSIGTNSIEPVSIDLKNGATVNGNVVVGPGGDADVVINAIWATITGETYAAAERYELAPVTVPQQLQELPSGGTIEESTTINSSGKYDEINLNSGSIIIIDGAVSLYVLGDVTLKNSAELQVVDADTNPDASLTLYLAGDVEVKNSGVVNNLAGDPKKIKIYGLNSCRSIILKNGSSFYGAIYAPNADVEMMNSADAFGAVVAKSFEQKNSATFNYDASLRDVNENEECVHFVVKQWSEQ